MKENRVANTFMGFISYVLYQLRLFQFFHIKIPVVTAHIKEIHVPFYADIAYKNFIYRIGFGLCRYENWMAVYFLRSVRGCVNLDVRGGLFDLT